MTRTDPCPQRHQSARASGPIVGGPDLGQRLSVPPTLADDGSWPGVPTPPPTRFACVRHGIQDRGPGGGSAGRANAQHQTVWLASTRVSGCCPRLLGYVNTAIKPEFRGTRVITEAGPAQDLGRSCCSPKRRTRDRRPGQARGHFPIHETGDISDALSGVREAAAYLSRRLVVKGFCGMVVCVREGSPAGMDAGGTPAGGGCVSALWGWCVSADAQAYFGTRPGLAPGRRHDV